MRFAVVSSWCLSVSAWSDCCGDIDGNLLVQFASQGMQTRQALNSTTLPELPLLRKEVVSPLLGTSSLISRIALCTTAFSLVILSVSLALRGLPQKTPRNRAADGFPPGMFSFYWAVVAGVYFSADVYVPSMPQMEIDLDGSESMVSGSVQINLFAKAAGCFITGPLSDRVGRRPVLVLCLGLITVASLCCMCATSIWWFLLARILQGLGEAVEPVVFASVRDFHDDLKERYSVFSRLWIGTWAGPLAAPLVGGVIANSTSWRVDFLVLSLLWASLLILACAAVPESAPKEDRNSFWHDLGTVLENWRQDCLLIAEGFFYSIYFCFLANVSYVMEVYYGQSTLTTCAVIAATIFICTAWSLVMNYFYSKATFSVIHVAQCGVLAMIVPILVDVVAGISFSNSMWGYVLQSAFHMGLMTGPVTSLPTLFMDPLENVAGLAACMEVVFSGFLCSLASFGSTKCLIEFGEAGALLFHAFIAMIAVLIFWLGQGIWRHSDAKAYVMLASSP